MSNVKPIRIVLIEPNVQDRRAICQLLAGLDDITITAEYEKFPGPPTVACERIFGIHYYCWGGGDLQ